MSKNIKLGELLIQQGLITPVQLNKALKSQSMYGGRLGTNLVQLDFISDEALAKFLTQQLGVASLSHDELQNIPKEVLQAVPVDVVEKHQLIPYKMDHRLYIAMVDPSQLEVVDDLQHRLGKMIHKAIAPELWILAALERYYGIQREARTLSLALDVSESDIQLEIQSTFSEALMEDVDGLTDYVSSAHENVHTWTFADFIQHLVGAESPIAVFQSLFKFAAGEFPQMLLFKKEVNGLRGSLLSGVPVHVKDFNMVSLKLASSSWHRWENLKYPVFNSLCNKLFAEPVLQQLHLKGDKDVFIFPIHFRGEDRFYFFGVCAEKPPSKNFIEASIPKALAKVSLQLDILFLRKELLSL